MFLIRKRYLTLLYLRRHRLYTILEKLLFGQTNDSGVLGYSLIMCLKFSYKSVRHKGGAVTTRFPLRVMDNPGKTSQHERSMKSLSRKVHIHVYFCLFRLHRRSWYRAGDVDVDRSETLKFIPILVDRAAQQSRQRQSAIPRM
ncbi:hypothetical protein M378DRAFT_162064 [Amanita muscaria Koide BX008]|uniref:Uncharacterized protein n=1 Tax=Amanita muscaria (strain Koide BX008) TaxID=946122 RepID=A0A0C2X9G6_AMAMK|nr:hypothetical protein M378DRAFT_162064 [Amanita muscaria Koide BX008]